MHIEKYCQHCGRSYIIKSDKNSSEMCEFCGGQLRENPIKPSIFSIFKNIDKTVYYVLAIIFIFIILPIIFIFVNAFSSDKKSEYINPTTPSTKEIAKLIIPTSIIQTQITKLYPEKEYPECTNAPIGENITCRISHAYCSYQPNVKGDPTFCNDAPYPNYNFTLLRWGENWSHLNGKCLLVTGYKYFYEDKQQIVATNISQIKDCDYSKIVESKQAPTCEVNEAALIDETYPDNTIVKPEQIFIKTWYLKNIGDCTWRPFKLVFVEGSPMSTINPIIFNKTVAPNEIVEVSVTLLSGRFSGTDYQTWYLKDLEGQYGQLFKGLNTIYVQVYVSYD